MEMKRYAVTITETAQMLVDVWAHSEEEAKQIVKEDWENGEYIIDASHFCGVDFEATDITPRVEMTYQEMANLFCDINENNLPHIVGYVVFTKDSFDKEYNETSRTYCISSNNKAYQSNMGGYSIYASCLDGTDPCVRLEGYMSGENAWKVEKCYVFKDDYDRLVVAKK